VATPEVAAQRAIEETLGHELSEPLVARVVARHASADHATLMVAASMPMRDLEWFAPTLEAPPAVKAIVVRTGSTVWSRRPWALRHPVDAPWRSWATWPSCTTCRDWSMCPRHRAPSWCWTTEAAGSFRSSRKRQALDHRRFELLFGTPPTSDVSDVARGFGLEVREVTTVPELEAALNQTSTMPSVVRVRVGGRAENVALHDAVNQAVCHALT